MKKTDSVEELAKLYSVADVFVNPTLEDNFPTTNLEALACGTPVISYDTGGSMEIVDEKCGYIVEKNNVTGLLDAIKRVRENGKLTYYENCIRRANENFNKDDRFGDYINLSERITN